MDVDSVKGCSCGLAKYGAKGCYGECYATKTARQYGKEFSKSVSRNLTPCAKKAVFLKVAKHPAKWYRIGTAGDPSHDWELTIALCEYLKPTGKRAVIITKHWNSLSAEQMRKLAELGAVVNTSVSAMDSDSDREYRLDQFEQLKAHGVGSVLRVVTVRCGNTETGRKFQAQQSALLAIRPNIDNPLRATRENLLVKNGDIKLTKRSNAVGGGKWVSLHLDTIYLGTCKECPDQCGINLVN